MLVTLLSFVFGLALLIAVHEYGHYRMALACGVRVLRFSIGFGKPLFTWRQRHTGTEFVLAAVPLGGFVRMLDERDAHVDSEMRHLAFNTQPLRSRALIVLAGPMANLFAAVFLYSAVNWWGVEQPKPVLGSPVTGSIAERAGFQAGDWVVSTRIKDDEPLITESFDQLRWVLTQAAIEKTDVQISISDEENGTPSRLIPLPLSDLDTREMDARLFQQIGLLAPFSAPRLGAVMPGGAGAAAGLAEGDLVRKVGTQDIQDAQQLRNRIRTSVGVFGQQYTQDWTIERNGKLLIISVKPKPELVDGKWTARIGAYVGAPPELTEVRMSFAQSLSNGLAKTWEMSLLTLKMMSQMLTGEASLKNLSGPVSIADHAGKSASRGLVAYVLFLAVISVSLGVLNLLPVPLLDGGHLMYYLYEAITGHEPSPVWTERLQRGGMTFLMGVMAIALFNDVARLLG